MAELHVQPKKHNAASTMWIWIVLALVIAGVVIYYLANRNTNAKNETAPATNTTGRLETSNNPLDVENILKGANVVAYLC